MASGSAIRAQMLKAVGLHFSVVPSGFDEDKIKEELKDSPVPEQAMRLAVEKAKSVAKDYPDALTIGADQMCELDGQILSKPHVKEKAIEQLRLMRGKTHHQHSAVSLVRGQEVVWSYVAKASLTLRTLSDDEIEAYIEHDQPLQSCGSYRMEGMGRHLMALIEGDSDVIKGLPLTALLAELHGMGAVTLGA
ncbi:MAG: Maf family protein [Rickettsiales bacterium]|nr:Maf family protein [Rickettsiales bacterium]